MFGLDEILRGSCSVCCYSVCDNVYRRFVLGGLLVVIVWLKMVWYVRLVGS